MWALVDCDNFFCSCERIFRPELNGVPVVVLSNNDGCVVARSREAKRLGIKMGIPYYQMLEQYPKSRFHIEAFSSNYKLYADISNRIMSLLRELCPTVYQYSIDEAMLDLSGMGDLNLKRFGENVSETIYKSIGAPVSIGIGASKTLAKVAVRFAKDYAGYNKCCFVESNEQREKALKLLPVGDIWGIGRRLACTLGNYRVKTAWDFAQLDRNLVKKKFTITGERTWRELNGEDIIPVDEMGTSLKKSIMTSRSFPNLISDINELKTHVSNYAARCALKLRKQKSVCRTVSVFIQASPFREDLEYYNANSFTQFLTPTSVTTDIIKAAVDVLNRIFKKGIYYKRAGVMVSDISQAQYLQPDLFIFDPERRHRYDSLSSALDSINRIMGSDTVIIASQQYPGIDKNGKHIHFSHAIKRDLKSPDYSTDFNAFQVKIK